MRRSKTAEESYDSCLAEGYVNEIQEINPDRIKSLVINAEITISTAQIVMKVITRQAREWMSVYVAHYEALRTYAEALLIFDRVSISNHQCLFSFLCIRHPELELSWDFFEKIRTKRNGINYYGEHVSYDDWKAIEVQARLYISTIKKEIEKRLSG